MVDGSVAIEPRVVRWTSVTSHWIHEGTSRLDGGFYATPAAEAQRLLDDSGFELRSLEELGGTASHPTQAQARSNFKRIIVDAQSGVPFITPSELNSFRPVATAFISPTMPKLQELFVPQGTLLLSRSGTVALPVLVTPRLSRFAISDDALRVTPGELLEGFLYLYMSTPLARAMIERGQYGSAIKHLEASHLLPLQIPLMPVAQQERFHGHATEIASLRDRANELLDEADEELHDELKLPSFSEVEVEYLERGARSATARAFVIANEDIALRFDASYHIPVVRAVNRALRDAAYQPKPLSQFASEIRIPPRFKRIYVNKSHGIPFLRPSQLLQLRPHDIGHISRRTPTLPSLLLRRGELVLSTDGTIGRLAVVGPYFESWAGSNNLARISGFTDAAVAGFLAAFLNTPYGQHQLKREVYGGVVDHIEVGHIAGVAVPEAPHELQISIGAKVNEAYTIREDAIKLEEKAIKGLHMAISGGTRATLQRLD